MEAQAKYEAGGVEAPLLPCPFCGGEAFIRSGENDYGRVTIGCNTHYSVCHMRPVLQMYRPDEEAIAAWNTRPGEEAAYEAGRAAERERVLEIIRYPKKSFPASYPDWMIGLIELDIINGVQSSGEKATERIIAIAREEGEG